MPNPSLNQLRVESVRKDRMYVTLALSLEKALGWSWKLLCAELLGLDQISGVWLESDPQSQGCRHKVWDSDSAHVLCPLHFLVPRFGVGQNGSSRLRPMTQRVRGWH